MNTWACLIIGGSAGTLARFLMSSWLLQRWGTSFPYGTLTVNLAGCFLIGCLSVVLDSRFVLSPQARLLLIAGFCGAFTTFSTLIFEFYDLIENGSWVKAFMYAMLSFAVGFWLFCVGIWFGHKIS